MVGSFVHPCEGELVCKLEHRNIPYFNAFIYTENKQEVGKVEDIFGAITDAVRRRLTLSPAARGWLCCCALMVPACSTSPSSSLLA